MSFIPQRAGKDLKTPQGVPMAVPTQQLADAISSEWAQIKGLPKREQIPLTQYANTAIDHTAPNRDGAIKAFLGHAEGDLLCYRADEPPALAARQAQLWQPLLDWARATYGADLAVFIGLMPQSQNPAALTALRQQAEALDDFKLLALAQAAGLFGSAVLALALLTGRLNYQQAMELSLLDELFQSEQWGEPEELKEKRDGLEKELSELAQFINLLGA